MMKMWAVVLALVAAAAGEENSKEFSIRPSIDGSVTVAQGAFRCSFSWTDCTGGSSEVWEAKISVRDGKPECMFGRPRMSYLTFTQWKAELNTPDADVMAADGEGREMLRDSDYKVKFGDGSVTVTNAKSDRHTMQGIQLFGN